MNSNLMCLDSVPAFLNAFDLSIAPPLLFYSYIPIIFLSLIFGFLVFFKDKKSLRSKLLLLIALFFSAWIINILVQWTGVYVNSVHFAWQLTGFFEVSIYLLSIYFLYVFIEQRDFNFSKKLLIAAFFLPVIALTPTIFNIQAFDLENCEGVVGYLWDYIYALEALVVVWIAVYGFTSIRRLNDRILKTEVAVMTTGMTLFLGIFLLSNFIGEITQVYEINLIGPIGMVSFLGLFTYIIVKFRAFNIRLIGANALVFVLWALIVSLIFINDLQIIHRLIFITIVLVIIFGILLIRSVSKEVHQREEIEKLNGQLESLIHFISHEVKGYLSKGQAVFSGIIEGDYGEMPEGLKGVVVNALSDSRAGVDTVTNILNSANVKKGTIKFDMKPFDMKSALDEVLHELKPAAESKGLIISTNSKGGDFTVLGDKEQIAKHVIRNLIDNAVRYTPRGEITVSMIQMDGKVRLSIKDSGVGITKEDMDRLFTEGGRGRDSVKVNVSSTGYGLYFAKGIVEAHKGKIWAESEGQGKGSTFIVELPVKA